MEAIMAQTGLATGTTEFEFDFDLTTSSGVDRFFAITHHAQQKVCATILHSSLIDQLIDRPEIDRDAVKTLLGNIMSVSYAAAGALHELQGLVRDQLTPQSASLSRRRPMKLVVG